jgi:hypothetical protein
MDTNGQYVSLVSTNIGWPNALAIDFSGRWRYCWLQADQVINTCDSVPFGRIQIPFIIDKNHALYSMALLCVIILLCIEFIHADKTIYWADAKLGTVETAQMDGTRRRVLFIDEGSRYFNMHITPKFIYFTDWTER